MGIRYKETKKNINLQVDSTQNRQRSTRNFYRIYGDFKVCFFSSVDLWAQTTVVQHKCATDMS